MSLLKEAGLAILALAACCSSAASAGEIALTFDDMPGIDLPDPAYVHRINRDLLAGLQRHQFTATAFVNAGKFEQLRDPRGAAFLRTWLQGGMDLGNHTYSHESVNALGADAFMADVIKGEPVLLQALAGRHRALHWFRFPDLETGADAATKRSVEEALAARHYRSAPVTIDPDDWQFAEPYDEAVLHHDKARQKQIAGEYIAHLAEAIDWSRKASNALFGREIAFIILLHDSKLNADHMDSVARVLGERHLRVVSLDEAIRDPAYATPDGYVGPDGIEWLERWSRTLGRTLPWDDYPDVPADIVAAYDRIEHDQSCRNPLQPRRCPGGS
ncbi:MAG TPA: polysaccharide deacetylase family protein [Novosphingobium sp.]|nr:polysaccharide deacetylase family protein [Novosphingobium sp.]